MSHKGMKKLVVCLLILICIAGGAYFSLVKIGYWSEQNKALRQLKKLDIPATPEQVQRSVQNKDAATLSLLGIGGIDFNSPETANEAGDPPLHVAVKKQDWKTYDTLIKFNSDPNLKDAAGMPALYYLLKNRDLEQAEKLFTVGANANFTHSSGEPALIQYLKEEKLAKQNTFWLTSFRSLL